MRPGAEAGPGNQLLFRADGALIRQAFRDQGGVEGAALVVAAQADNAVIVAYLAGVNIIHFLAAVFLAGPACGIVIRHHLFLVRTSLPDSQGLFVFVASYNYPFPAGLLVTLARLRGVHRSAFLSYYCRGQKAPC